MPSTLPQSAFRAIKSQIDLSGSGLIGARGTKILKIPLSVKKVLADGSTKINGEPDYWIFVRDLIDLNDVFFYGLPERASLATIDALFCLGLVCSQKGFCKVAVMESITSSRSSVSGAGLSGALMIFSLAPLLFVMADGPGEMWARLAVAVAACTAGVVCAQALFRHPLIGRLFGGLALVGGYGLAYRPLLSSPSAALSGTVMFISFIFLLVNAGVPSLGFRVERCLHRAWWAALAVPVLVFFALFFGEKNVLTDGVMALASAISYGLLLHWVVEKRGWRLFWLPFVGWGLIGLALFVLPFRTIPGIAAAGGLLILSVLSRFRAQADRKESGWELLMDHPARILLTTFFALCFLGTLLLSLPVSLRSGMIRPIDAMFTSVSAVCVTGLVVLDTGFDFSVTGQFFILLLIQLGGLGIMTITTVALHSLGRRLSLRQERILNTITDTDHSELYVSLKTILKFTFIAEGIGAVLLGLLFHWAGDPLPQSIWKGIFTAVSAFCNAGFALQSDSLIGYQAHPCILHTVGLLIIFGGMAPATSLMVPRWVMGRQITLPARIALVATAILLVAGMLAIAAFEWNGILAGLSVGDKLHNAWFQSVTLRTAGFNSLEIGSVSNLTYLLMLVFMFIGGSPGGTAGGVKTATVGILALTFWSHISNRNEVILQNRRILPGTIYRGVTIVLSGSIILFLVVLMLEATQQISARGLIFEATSALGTVGLSTGDTARLDEIGKLIVAFAMFVGRIGPMTLFMMLNNEQPVSVSRCPAAKISLT